MKVLTPGDRSNLSALSVKNLEEGGGIDLLSVSLAKKYMGDERVAGRKEASIISVGLKD